MDSRLRVTFPEDGVYALSVRDHLRRGGETFAYRVEATPVEPSLRLTLLETAATSVIPQGNFTYLLANVSRSDFDGPIKVDLLGLPEGVTASSPVIPAGQAQMPIIIQATPEAALAKRARGCARSPSGGGQHAERRAGAGIRLVQGNNDTTFFGRMVDRLALAVSEPAPFSVEIVPPRYPP